ncbi:MAG: M23 family metallopeptidase [Flavicella sp.]
MAKVKFYYDSDTLSYQRIQVKNSTRVKNTLLFIVASILVAFIGFIGFSAVIKSPLQKKQERELENLKLHFELLSKRIDEGTEVLEEIQDRDNNIYRVFFEAEPISKEQRMAGFGGINRYKSLDGFENSVMIKDVTKKVDVLSKQMVIQSKSLDAIVDMAKNKQEMLASIPAIQPVSNKNLKRMASGYGYRIHPIYKTRKMHSGMDFSAPKGTPIYATGNGKVESVKKSRRGYGNVVKINHGFGYKTVYAHMQKFIVRRGQKVKRGDMIGYVGSSGTSTAPHLHYEVHKGKKKVNPIFYYFNDLTPEEYDLMLDMAGKENQSLD